MTKSSSVRFMLACALCTTISSNARSQPQSSAGGGAEQYSVRAAASEDESYGVVFEDDPMFALGPDTLIPRISVRRGVPMTRLLRPRTSFVHEIVKSAETF